MVFTRSQIDYTPSELAPGRTTHHRPFQPCRGPPPARPRSTPLPPPRAGADWPQVRRLLSLQSFVEDPVYSRPGLAHIPALPASTEPVELPAQSSSDEGAPAKQPKRKKFKARAARVKVLSGMLNATAGKRAARRGSRRATLADAPPLPRRASRQVSGDPDAPLSPASRCSSPHSQPSSPANRMRTAAQVSSFLGGVDRGPAIGLPAALSPKSSPSGAPTAAGTLRGPPPGTRSGVSPAPAAARPDASPHGGAAAVRLGPGGPRARLPAVPAGGQSAAAGGGTPSKGSGAAGLVTPSGSGSPRSKRSRPRAPSTSGSRRQSCTELLPFGHSDYLDIRRCFEELDHDRSGSLDWNEICDIGTRLGGRQIDYMTFKRIDKDRSGTISFIELLRMFYPGVPVVHLRAALRKWGPPHRPSAGALQHGAVASGASAGLRWRDRMDPQSVEELCSIFELYHGSREGGLTLAELRKGIPPSRFPDEYLVEVFEQHCRGGDGLKLDEFAAMMDQVYGKKEESGPLKLYFQPECFMREL